MADNRLSTFLPNRSVMGAKMLQRPAEPYLRQLLPEAYGALSGFMGTAPDQQGSVLDPNTARARAGAEIGFPLGTALQMMPFAKPAAAGVKALGPTAGRMAEGYLQRQGLMPSIVPGKNSVKSIDDLLAKYPDVKIDASVNKNDLNLSRIVVPKNMRNQGIGTQVMNDLSEYADSIGKRITLTPSSDFGGNVGKLKDFYKDLGFVENKGRNKDFSTREAMYREPKPLEKVSEFQYPQEEAMRLAQQRAALPAEQGGLGLPVGNTAMDRARAMGYPMGKGFDVSYETGHSPISITNTFSKPTSPRNKAEIIKAELEQMGIPVVGETAGTGSTYLKIPGNPYDISPEYGGGQSVPIETLRFSTHSKREFGKPTNRPDLDSYIADIFPKGGNSLEEARKAIDDLIKQGGIRSRFAAFDPFRRSAAIAAAMGVAAPDLLAAQPKQQPSQNSLNSFIR